MDNMKNTGIVKKELRQEIAMFGSDKNLEIQKAKIDEKNSLFFWVDNYFSKMVVGGKEKTKDAKKMDLQKFLSFFSKIVTSHHIDHWTPSVTKEFQKFLLRVELHNG